MKNKIIKVISAIGLMVFSFYYTNKSIDFIRHTDPIMKKIASSRSKFEIKATNAKIDENKIIPGTKGKKVDENKSYSKMKKYGAYNESLTTLESVNPKVSLSNHYDKYVVRGNESKKQISLIFKIDTGESLNLITNYLDNEEIPATLFINEDIIDKNIEKIKKLTNYQVELYFNKISQVDISTSSNYLHSITGIPNKYCYTEEENDNLLKICKKYKMHTIIPNVILNKNPTKKIKDELSNGYIISVELTNAVKKELDYIIRYIKSKGYTFQRLDTLLQE